MLNYRPYPTTFFACQPTPSGLQNALIRELAKRKRPAYVNDAGNLQAACLPLLMRTLLLNAGYSKTMQPNVLKHPKHGFVATLTDCGQYCELSVSAGLQLATKASE